MKRPELKDIQKAREVLSRILPATPVPYTPLTLPTNREVEISVAAGSLKKKKNKKKR